MGIHRNQHNFKGDLLVKIKLDHLGQFYGAVNSEKNPGTFSIGVHLKEPLEPITLQRAVNDLMKRLPHMNVRKHSGFFHYYNVAMDNPLKIEEEGEHTEPCRYFPKGKYLLRIPYGKRHFTLEVLHSVCDGRSLAIAASSLLIRYFELMEIKVSKEGFINCDSMGVAEEAEDAYLRHADMKSKYKSGKNDDAYVPKHQATKSRIITQKFDLGELKPRAKAYGVTLSEYIMAHIFSEFAKQRAADGVAKAITCNVPIDCRGFFPTKSLRNFVSSQIVKMPETADFTEIAQGIKAQLAEINPDYIQGKISEMEKMIRLGRFVPLFTKKWIIRSVGHGASAGCSTGFSNLGLIKLPAEIEGRVDMYTFALGAEPNMPYQFACVATGGVLTLTVTIAAEDTAVIDRIGVALRYGGCRE